MAYRKLLLGCFISIVTVICTLEASEEMSSVEFPSHQPSSSNFLASIELRPSWESNSGRVFSENAGELGYRFNSTTHLTYMQEFQNRLYDSTSSVGQSSDFHVKDGYLHAQLNDIWSNKALGLALSLESRAYFPTHSTERERGLISAFRNYLKIKKDISDEVSITAMEIPIVYSYNKAGAIIEGQPDANPSLENRFSLIVDVAFTEKVTLSVPIMMHNTKHSTFQEGAKHSGTWAHVLWIYPELTYIVAPNLLVGVAYYSQNLISEDFSGVTLSNGLKNGVGQFIVKAFL